MIESLLADLADGRVVAPLGGLLVGVLLSLSPLSLPGVAAAVATVSPGRVNAQGLRERLPLRQIVPVVVAFVVGMDGVLAVLGYVFVQVTVAFTRASVALHLVAAGLLAIVGLRLLVGRHSLCSRAQAIPPRPADAFLFGLLFSVTGCPGCAPIVIALATTATLLAGPVPALLALVAFVAGRSLVLVAAGRLGSRLLPVGDVGPTWRRLDVLAGLLFTVAASYYVFRVAAGDVTTLVPGEPGSGVLPG